MNKNIENGYLLDTNIVSMLFRAKNGETDPQCQSVLSKATLASETGIAVICSATVGEIEYGLKVSIKPDPAIHTDLRAFVGTFPFIYVIDHHIASDYYADLRARLFKKYAPKDARGKIKGKLPEEMLDPTTGKVLGIQENDLWIVSVAMGNNLTLVTNDKMERIREIVKDEITFENWAE